MIMQYFLYSPHRGYGSYGYGWIAPAAVGIILLVIILYFLFRGPGAQNKKEGSSLEILRERYAKGEITKEQFEEMRKDLEK